MDPTGSREDKIIEKRAQGTSSYLRDTALLATRCIYKHDCLLTWVWNLVLVFGEEHGQRVLRKISGPGRGRGGTSSYLLHGAESFSRS